MIEKSTLRFLLILVNSMPILAASLYFPAMPMMAEYYNVEDGVIQHSVSFFQLGVVVTALIYGPLSDRYGRRPVLLLGYTLFLIASLALTFPLSIDNFLLIRFIQACGAGVSMGLAQAVIRDIFTEKEAGKLMAQIFTIVVIIPAVAPLLGGYLAAYFGWVSCFVFTCASVFVAWVILYFAFPETLNEEHHVSIHPRVLMNNYKNLLQHKSFILYSMISGFSFSGFWFYRTAMPFVFIKYLGVAVEHYGYYVFIQVISFSITSFYVQRVIMDVGGMRLIAIGHYFLFAGCVIMLLAVFYTPHDPLLLALSYLPYSMGSALMGGASITKAMSLVTRTHGVASALVGSIRQFFMAVGSLLAAFFTSDTLLPAVIFMCVFAGFSFISFALGKRYEQSEA